MIPAGPARSSVPAAPRRERTADAGASDPSPRPADEDLRDVSPELWLLLAELARTPEVELDAEFPEEGTGEPGTKPPG
jgi:hypothetical protein